MCMCANLCADMHVRMCMCACACAHVHVRMCMRACACAHVHVCMCRALGRGDSDVYVLYTRSSREAALRFGAVVASTAFTDFEGDFADEEFVVRRGYRMRRV